MKVAIMQPYFFPYIGYFQLMNAVDKFVFYDDVSFINRGWINRNKILINKEPFLFSVPLESASQNRKIREIKVSNDPRWRNKFLKTLEQSYKSAPYFERTYSLVKDILNSSSDYLKDWILKSFSLIKQELDLPVRLIESSEIYNNAELKGAERILDIVKTERAEFYVNPIGGKVLYSQDEFVKNGITLLFLRTKDFSYKQFGDAFIPNLSFIDVLMFNSNSEIKSLLNLYDLIE